MKKSNPTFTKIREIVAKIPEGKVATYGQIAEIAGIKDARIVGWALSGNKDPKIPCHRVLKRDGSLVENYSFGDWRDEKEKLLSEGIEFLEVKKVNLNKHLWDGKIRK